MEKGIGKRYLVLVDSYDQIRKTGTCNNYRQDLLILAIADDGRVIVKESRAMCLGDESRGKQERPMDAIESTGLLDFEDIIVLLNGGYSLVCGEAKFVRKIKVIGPNELQGLLLTTRRFNIAVELLKFSRGHVCLDKNTDRPYWLPRNFYAQKKAVFVEITEIGDALVKKYFLDDGSTVEDLLRKAKMSANGLEIWVNGEKVEMSQILKDRDIIILAPLVPPVAYY